MNNVVSFEREKRLWFCHCGCCTHYVHQDGTLECAACESTATMGGYAFCIDPPKGPDIEVPETGTKVFCDFNSREFSLRRLGKRLLEPGLYLAAVLWDSGRVTSVGKNPETPADRKWVRKQLSILAEQIGAKEPKSCE
jgi:hypothetical protein